MLFRKPVAVLTFTLSLTATTAFAVGMHADEPAAAASDSQPPAPGAASAAFVGRIRLLLVRMGIDPDGANGKSLLAWAGGLMSDPDWSALLTRRNSPGANAFNLKTLSLAPAARLQVLKDFSVLAPYMPAGVFGGARLDAADFGKFLNALPPGGVAAFENLLDVMVKQHDTMDPAEHYSTAELLELENRFDTVAETASANHKIAALDGKGGALNGQDVAFFAGLIVDLPEPLRTRASWALLPGTNGDGRSYGAITRGVLDDPYPYLADMFDDRALPASLHERLPADGSRPLPFRRLTVEGNWVDTKKPGSPHPCRYVYANLHDNGVVAEVAERLADSGQTVEGPAYFTTNYGLVALRKQRVGFGTDWAPVAQVLDSSTVALGSRVPAEGEQVEFPVAQPSDDGVQSTRCLMGKTQPAASIFPTLKGDAVDVTCTHVAEHGAGSSIKSVWLPDYGITLMTGVRNDGERRFEIKSVTVSE